MTTATAHPPTTTTTTAAAATTTTISTSTSNPPLTISASSSQNINGSYNHHHTTHDVIVPIHDDPSSALSSSSPSPLHVNPSNTDVDDVHHHHRNLLARRHNRTTTTANNRSPLPKSFDFEVSTLDPPTQLIGDFLKKQAASGKLCLDMDMNMMDLDMDITMIDSLPLTPTIATIAAAAAAASSSSNSTTTTTRHTRNHPCSVPTPNIDPNHVVAENGSKPSSVRNVSFEDGPAEMLTRGLSTGEVITTQKGPNLDHDKNEKDDQCSSSSGEDESETGHRTSQRRSSLHRAQTRSRLADLPQGELKSAVHNTRSTTQPNSGAVRSQALYKSTYMGKPESEEEDDPLKDEDIPESLRKQKCSVSSALQWIAFFIIMGGLICSLSIPTLAHWPLWSMALWKWALLVLLLFCGRLVSGWVIRILVIIVERNFLLRKRVLYFVYALRKGVQNCIWFIFAILAWRLVFDPKVRSSTHSKVLPYVTKVLYCFLIGAVLWLIKIFLVKVLASSFHVSTYFERIRESLFGQWVLETLSGPPVIEMEEENKLLEELSELRKAGAKVPRSIWSPNANNQATSIAPKKRSGKIGAEKSGNLLAGKGGMKSGMIATNGKSGFIAGGKSGMLRPKSQQLVSDGCQEEGISIDHLQRWNQNNISAWNMKRLVNLVRYRGIYTIANIIDESVAAVSQDDAQDMEIQSEWQAKAAAKKIFKNVAMPNARYIERKDLLRFMRENEVEKAFPLFDHACESGKISKAALKSFAVHVVRERRALAMSLTDTKTAVKKLHRIVDVVVGVVIIIIAMLILGLTTTHLLLLVSSQLVLVVFIFGNTCKTVFEAIVFLFVMHPFDVGDRCVVDGNQLVVEEMNILSTVFMKGNGEKVWYPNSILATKYIFNYSRTPDTGDSFEFSIDANTPSEKISLLKEKISKYIASKPNHWKKDHHLLVKSIENNNKMNLQLTLNHTLNYNEDLERQIRKSDLILDVKRMLQGLDIGYGLLPQEVQLSYLSKPICDSLQHPHPKSS